MLLYHFIMELLRTIQPMPSPPQYPQRQEMSMEQDKLTSQPGGI